MSLVERLHHARDVRRRLMMPPNAVIDRGIDLRRQVVVPIRQAEPVVQDVPFTRPNPNEVFGPVTLTDDDIAFGPVVHPRDPLAVRTDIIIKAVCRYFGISRRELMSRRRTAPLVRPRQIGMWLTKTLTLRSYPSIARAWGRGDHTTALYAVNKIESLRAEDSDLDQLLRDLSAACIAYEKQSRETQCSSAPTPAA